MDNNVEHLKLYQNLYGPLQELGEEIYQNKVRHGWKITLNDDWINTHEIPGVLMLIVSEAAEALSAFRDDDKNHFAEELADIIIRTLGLAHTMDIDLAKAIVAKIEFNKTRPIKHGRKKL